VHTEWPPRFASGPLSARSDDQLGGNCQVALAQHPQRLSAKAVNGNLECAQELPFAAAGALLRRANATTTATTTTVAADAAAADAAAAAATAPTVATGTTAAVRRVLPYASRRHREKSKMVDHLLGRPLHLPNGVVELEHPQQRAALRVERRVSGVEAGSTAATPAAAAAASGDPENHVEQQRGG